LLERAIEVAETAGDLEGAGRATLSIIEELGEKLPAKELVAIYCSHRSQRCELRPNKGGQLRLPSAR